MEALCETFDLRGQVALTGCTDFLGLVEGNLSPDDLPPDDRLLRTERRESPVPTLGIPGLPLLEWSAWVSSAGDRDNVSR